MSIHIVKALKTPSRHRIFQTFLSADYTGIFGNNAVKECGLICGSHLRCCVSKMKERVKLSAIRRIRPEYQV